jgi:hypothetical protein
MYSVFFRSGSPTVKVSRFSMAFIPGDIAKLEIPLLLNWTEPVNATVSVNYEGVTVQSQVIQLEPEQPATSTLFLETPANASATSATVMVQEGATLLGNAAVPVTLLRTPSSVITPAHQVPRMLIVAVLILVLLLLVARVLWRKKSYY